MLLLAVIPVGASVAGNTGPISGGDAVTLEPVTGDAAPRPAPTRRRVFTCVTPGLTIFSDRPCGPLPDVREVHWPQGGAVPQSGSGPVVAARADPERSPRGSRSSGEPSRTAARDRREDTAEREARERAAACERLEQAVQDLDQRLRAGYTAREAGRLWARWREAKERLRDARC
jgi:hypothetical protein